MKILLVAGARPNFMKIAPIIDAIKIYNAAQSRTQSTKKSINYILLHTGQHYDDKMSRLFFDELEIPKPDINLGVGSGSHAKQTAEIMKRFEPILKDKQPDIVIVVGDVNSTVACSLVASKIEYTLNQLPHQSNQRSRPLIAHVEAGLRSFDRTMPEEINRLLTDQLSDFLFTTEQSANENLRREGIPQEKIFFVGNTMIDTLLKHKKKAEQSNILYKLNLTSQANVSNSSNQVDPSNSRNSINSYAILTLHRPSNVDDKRAFQEILEALSIIAKELPIIFPVHPRTLNRIHEFVLEKYFSWEFYDSIASNNPINLNPVKPESRLTGALPSNNLKNSAKTKSTSNSPNSINLVPPLGYLDFLHLMTNATLVLTDSGGIQEETTILGIPCVTLRENTERPVTVTSGTNVIAGTEKENIISAAYSQLNKLLPREMHGLFHRGNKPKRPKFWDGKSAERVIKVITDTI